ncbi:MAG: response regulator [Pontiellaceae bacterium]|nr:response regulator [Pontiellaceae bacterium]MBN2785018.1 response regulator [Pontiellaceae bacterium]
MNYRFFSLTNPSPEGFTCQRPEKRDLLGSHVALHACTIEECTGLMDQFTERVAGLIITPGEHFSYKPIGPHLWHLQTSQDARYKLQEIAEFTLRQIESGLAAAEEITQLRTQLERSLREHQEARREHGHQSTYLTEKVQTLRDEVQKRQAIEAQLHMYKIFSEKAVQGMGWINLKGDVMYANPAAQKIITGAPEKNIIGTNIADFFPPDEHARIMNEIIPYVLEEGQWSGELRVKRIGTDELIPIGDTASLIHDTQTGEPLLANVIYDLRDQRRIEEERIKIKKLESVGQLAGGIAHDFNNLLSCILGNISLAAESLEINSDAGHLLEDARKATLQAKGLTQQLLTFAEGGDPIRKTASIDNVIKDSTEFVLHGSNIKCRYNIPDDLWKAEIDAGQISQVIQNLVLNAIEAMPDGGSITVACGNKPARNGHDADCIKIMVIDEGCGILQEDLERVFDPYFTTKDGASGLGLSICHSIISKHGGSISIESHPGHRTSVSILIPRTVEKAEEPAAVPLRESQPLESGKLRILVMDDEPLIRKTCQRILTRLGHEIYTAKDGNEAVEVYRRQQQANAPIQLSIMDLTIPGGLGGQYAVKAVKEIDPGALVIVASGYSSDPVMANYTEHGFAAAIAKPFEIAELQEVINQLGRGAPA